MCPVRGSQWRAIFLINIPVGAAIIAAAWWCLPADTQRTARHLDLPGVATLSASPLVSGLTLVPWVAAFGLAGQLVRRLPPRMTPLTPAAGCLLLAAAYAAISTI